MYTLKLIESIVSLTWLVLALVVSIFILSVNNNRIAMPDPEDGAFCGTISEIDRAPVEDRPLMREGKRLFKNNCATCHNKDMKSDLTGPALAGVEERWGEYPKEDLYNWIRNSEKLVQTRHPRAKRLFNDWGQSRMTAFPNLKDEEIDAILMYIERF